MAYDTSTANPVNPQGTAGGGNVLNAGSIFGSQSLLGSGSSGDNGAGTGSSDTAALGGPAVGGNATPAVGSSSGLSALLSSPAIIIGIVVALLAGITGAGILIFRRKKA